MKGRQEKRWQDRLRICLPCIWKCFKVYGTSCKTKSRTESGLIVEFWGEEIMNREICIDELQAVIEIFNLQGLGECIHVETTL